MLRIISSLQLFHLNIVSVVLDLGSTLFTLVRAQGKGQQASCRIKAILSSPVPTYADDLHRAAHGYSTAWTSHWLPAE